jgi:hypothetical protein
VSEAIQQGRGHLGITEDGGPFAEAEVGGNDDAGALVNPYSPSKSLILLS